MGPLKVMSLEVTCFASSFTEKTLVFLSLLLLGESGLSGFRLPYLFKTLSC